MGGCAEVDIPDIQNFASYSLQAPLSSGTVCFVPKNMHGAG